MKNLKRGGCFFLLFAVLNSYGQSKHNFALHAGPLLGKSVNYYTNAPYIKLRQPYRLGFALGFTYDYGFHNNFGIRTGIDYEYTVRKIRIENMSDRLIFISTTSKDQMLYMNSLELPLHVYYQLHTNAGNFKILFGLGCKIHLGGKYKQIDQTTTTFNVFLNQTNVTTSTKEGLFIFDKAPDQKPDNVIYHKRFNPCINIGLVYDYQRYMVEFKYMYGLTNQFALPQNPDNNVVTDRYNTSTFGLNFGYYIHK